MNPAHVSRIKIEGYKSIKECDLELRDVNVLIGANGAGKSNFIGFFKFLQSLLEGNLQAYIAKNGGPDSLLHYGRKKTEQMKAELHLGDTAYRFVLEPTTDNRLMFAGEKFGAIDGGVREVAPGRFETVYEVESLEAYHAILGILLKWRIYHFHDTGDSALVKQRRSIGDNEYLRPDARNLAAFLFRLKEHHPEQYTQIVKTVRLVAPFFGDFRLRRNLENSDLVELEWSELGDDEPFKAYQLSDGTLRFICLATVFLQPEELQPETILVDEPELGLHPYAIEILGSLIRSASKTKQVIVSTQSVTLLNEFEPGDVVVADRKDGASVLRRVAREELTEWLEEYTLGQLWEKNILGGRPAR